jgi:hypothetical protein
MASRWRTLSWNFDQVNYPLELTALSEEEIEEYVIGPIEPDPKDDIVPDPPKVPITKTGDLWQLGKHRLLCGDSTKKSNVGHLMGQERADMVFTDPPYGVNFKYNNYDDNITKAEHRDFCEKWLNIIKNISDFIVITVGFDNEYIFYDLDRKFKQMVWNKKYSISSSSIAFARVTEPIFVLGKPKKGIITIILK